MAEQEQQRTAYAEPRVVNLLSALAPTLEGLFMVTTLDGKQGKLLLRYHVSQSAAFEALCDYLQTTFPQGFRLDEKLDFTNGSPSGYA